MSGGSAKRRAEMARDLGAQIGLGRRRPHIDPAVDQSIDQRSDDLGPVQDLAALAADIGGELIEVMNLSIEEDD